MKRKHLVRVELRDLSPNASYEERDRAFKSMLSTFKKLVNDAGILTEYKLRQYYESPAEKRKRKKKESMLQAHKEKINSHFSKKGYENV